MLVIRLQRVGRKKTPFYRIVVAQKSAAVQGKFLERLGHYNPLSTPKEYVLAHDRFEHWISVGAIPSDTIARLAAKNGIKGMEKFIAPRAMKTSNAEKEAQKKAAEAASKKQEVEPEALPE